VEAFPPYAFIGRAAGRPHPRRDRGGHSFGLPEATPPPLDPSRPEASADLRRGFALFDAGFYWEAHEAWEGLWHAAGRAGPVADLLRGLVKLAAAGVKVRQNEPRGVRSHGERAAAHFAEVRRAVGRGSFAGVDLDVLEGFARDVAARAESLRGDPAAAVEVVFSRRLMPQGLLH